jgi:taurine dioxygenase
MPSRDLPVLDLSPISPDLGAVVEGLDPSEPLAPATIEAIKTALVDRGVLALRGQRLSPERLVELSADFGSLLRVPYVEPMPDHPDIIAVLKEADETKISVFGGDWHSDFSFLERPPFATLLYALEVPPAGGDTIWADMRLAYEALSPAFRALIDPLKAMHSGHVYGAERPPLDIATSRSIKISRMNPEADVERAHPVVRLQPESGRRALFVNRIYTTRFAEMTEDESRPLLDFLYDHATRPEFCCRWRWQAGDLLMWDNRAVMHYAVNDYDGHRRLLHRTMVEGEAPRGPAEG